MIRKLGLAVIGLYVVSMLFTSCYYDVEEELYPVSKCDTMDISLYDDLLPIFDQRCMVCHNDQNNAVLGASVDLEGYDDLKVYVDNGKLLSSLKHDGNASPMPKGATEPIPECEIKKINAWINDGARDR